MSQSNASSSVVPLRVTGASCETDDELVGVAQHEQICHAFGGVRFGGIGMNLDTRA